MCSPLGDMKRSVYLWSYVLAELVPFMRQRLHLASIPEQTKSDHCNSGSTSSSSSSSSGSSCRCTLDAGSTRRLLLMCTSRRLSLDSILLASLFLATSEAVKIEQQQTDTTRAGGVRGTAEKAMAMKLHKSLVLGVVCVVMAMLSGSVESKAMRYFCSLYAVVAGIWAVNVITIEKPGHAIVMATTSTTIKIGIDAAEETFTPVRLSVDCGQDLWYTAERLHRQSRGMTCSMSSYARFKMHVRYARRLGAWRLEPQESPSEEAMDELTNSTYRPLQLFGCIRLEGTGGDGTEHRLAPKETLPGSPPCTSRGMTAAGDGHEGEGMTSSGVTTAAKSASALNEGGTPLRAELILTALDSKYTLFYRETAVVIDGGKGEGSDHEHGVPGKASGGDVVALKTLGRTAALPPPLHQDESRSQSKLELTLVEGTRALRGSGSDWLLDRSKAILLQGIRDITGDDP